MHTKLHKDNFPNWIQKIIAHVLYDGLYVSLYLQSVNVTFFSSDVIDAEPPSCQIPFNGTFLLPSPDGYDDELLPNCFVQDSREGDHLTYFWFKIFDWKIQEWNNGYLRFHVVFHWLVSNVVYLHVGAM